MAADRLSFVAGRVALLAFACAAACGDNGRSVTSESLLAAREDTANWLTYSGAYDSHRYSRLAQINSENVKQLVLQWEYPIETAHPIETSPIVVDGTMYLTSPPNDVIALNARNGRKRWEFTWPVPPGITTCCGQVNRGLAMLGRTLYMGTLDAHLVAIDAHTGRERWRVKGAEWSEGYRITSAPLAVRDLIVVGYALDAFKWRWTPPGSPPLLRGRVDAYDAETGALRWRFFTTPVRGEPGSETWKDSTWTVGGGSTWLTGSYDPELNLIYWGVGAPSAFSYGAMRPGDNLFTNSVVALDATTGAMRWHFQFTPHDVNDWDAAQIPVLADLELSGRQRKVLLTANRNGFFYVLDRTTGAYVHSKPFALQNWATRIDERGRPVLAFSGDATPGGHTIAPAQDGATNWWSPSFSPRTGLFYVNAIDATERVVLETSAAGTPSVARARNTKDLVSALRAIDPATGTVRWEHKRPHATSGILSTAGDVVFSGNTAYDALALDARSGEVLWKYRTNGWMHSAPITYLVGDRQQITIVASKAIQTFILDK